jgi:hypothetical protein
MGVGKGKGGEWARGREGSGQGRGRSSPVVGGDVAVSTRVPPHKQLLVGLGGRWCLPSFLSAHLSLIDSPTSRLDGEGAFAVVVGHGAVASIPVVFRCAVGA